MTQHIPVSNIEEQVIAAMFSAGIAPPQEGLLIDAHLHRFHLDGDKPGSKNGAYCIYPEGQSYNGWPNGFFQDHKRGGELEKWQYKPTKDDHEKLDQAFQSAISQETATAKRQTSDKMSQEEASKAKERAQQIYEGAPVAQPDHPYLVRKNVGVFGDLRQSGNDLVVPLRDVIDDSFVTHQRIQPDGFKNFVSPLGGDNPAFTIAGDLKEGPIILCEGLATGLTLYEAVGYTTVCAMTCGNLVKVSAALRTKYPDRKIFIAADDDMATKKKTGRNPGLDSAKKALQTGLDGILRAPFLPEDGDEVSDWNDYAQLHGMDTTTTILGGQIEQLLMSPEEKKHLAKMEKIHKRTRIVNAADLMQKELPPIRWALQDIIPAGLCVLIGRPKIGKSSFTLGIATAIACGGTALGRIDTACGDVLYLALEDTERRLQQRIRAMGNESTDLSRIDFVFEIPRQHEGGLTFVEEWLKTHPNARLIVIDTLQKFRKPRTPNANAYEDDYETLAPVKEIADRHDVAILCLHHEKKSRDAEDFINNASGSAAITGSADCLLFLNRARHQGVGKLNLTGRDVEEREYALSLDGMEWCLEGDAHEYEMASEKRAILDYLKENGETSPKDLADALEVKPNTMRQKLLRMSKEGLVYSNGGRYGVSASSASQSYLEGMSP
ncbi:AAA family ATPase [Synergistaceae bacterium OttesenSCG-928-I11]|nr:AAA family ATPase [Synergistaceae bacterium OttesenSCG-928-I11]